LLFEALAKYLGKVRSFGRSAQIADRRNGSPLCPRRKWRSCADA
jgi:hypothetical protein